MHRAKVTKRWVEIVAEARGLMPIQARRLFGSARRLEEEAARVLAEKATAHGREVWAAKEDRPDGDTLFDQLAARAYDQADRTMRATARQQERDAFRAMGIEVPE